MKAIKWIAGGLVVLVAVVLIGGYVALSSFDVEQMRGPIQDQVKQATGRDLVIAGPIDLAISLTPAIEVSDVTFSNAGWGSRPEMVKLSKLALQVSIIPLLSGDVVVDRLVLDGADILLETDKAGEGNWAFSPPAEAETTETTTAAGEEGMAFPSIEAISITNSRLTYSDGATGASTVLALDDVSADRSPEGLDVKLAGSYQSAAFVLAGRIGLLTSLMSATPYPVKLEGTVAGAKLSIDGTIANLTTGAQPDLAFSVEGEKLSDFGALTGGELPPVGPYKVAGKVTGSGKAYTLAGLTASVGGSDLAGDVSVDVGGERPMVTAALTSTTLNLADFGGGGATGEAAAAPASDSPYVIPDEPLPVDALRSVDAKVDAKVGTLKLDPKTELTDVVVALLLENGALTVQPLTAAVSGGQVNVTLALDAAQETPSLNLQATLDDLDYGKLAALYEVTDEVQGTVDAKIDLAGAGATPHAIASTLDGRTEILAEDGVINNKLLAIVASGLGEVMGPLFGGKETTALNCVVSRFAIKGGVATSEAQVVDTATFSVAGGGTIDLRSEKLDMQFDTETREAALVSLAIPFNVTGTLKEPNVAPDPAGAAMAAAKLAGGVAGASIDPMAALGALAGGGQASSEEGGGNACLNAVSGAAPAAATEGGSATDTAVDAVTDAIEDATGAGSDAVEGVTEGLQNLLGD